MRGKLINTARRVPVAERIVSRLSNDRESDRGSDQGSVGVACSARVDIGALDYWRTGTGLVGDGSGSGTSRIPRCGEVGGVENGRLAKVTRGVLGVALRSSSSLQMAM